MQQKTIGPYEECFDDVQKTFSQYENVKLIRGTIPETLTQVESHKIAYLSVDLNCAEPEIDAANYFWERLTPGAVVVLDDYGAGALYQAQKVAWDDFATAHSTSILSLPDRSGNNRLPGLRSVVCSSNQTVLLRKPSGA